MRNTEKQNKVTERVLLNNHSHELMFAWQNLTSYSLLKVVALEYIFLTLSSIECLAYEYSYVSISAVGMVLCTI